MNVKVIKIENYFKKKQGTKRKEKIKAFLCRIQQEVENPKAKESESESEAKENESKSKPEPINPLISKGIVIKEGGGKKGDDDIGDEMARKQGKRKLEESEKEIEAREHKEVARVLKRMKMGSSNKFEKKKEKVSKKTPLRRRRSSRMIASGITPNYCEGRKKKAKENEVIKIMSSNEEEDEEFEKTISESPETDMQNSNENEEDLSDIEFQRMLEEGFRETRTKKRQEQQSSKIEKDLAEHEEAEQEKQLEEIENVEEEKK